MRYRDIAAKTRDLLTGEIAARVLGIATFALLARALGVRAFGVFAFGLSVSLIAIVAIDMGQNSHLQRTIGASGSRVSVYQIGANKLALGAVVAMLAGGASAAAGLGRDAATTVAALVCWGTLLSIMDSLRSISRSHDRMRADSAANAGESLLRLAVVTLGWILHAGVVEFAGLFVVEAVVALGVTYRWAVRSFDLGPRVRPTARAGVVVLYASAGLGMAALVSAGFYRIDQVLVMGYLGPGPTGLYDAATRTVFAATVFSGLVASAVYPELVRARDDACAYSRALVRAATVALAGGVGSAVLVALLAKPIVLLLYGRSYEASAGLIVLLVPVVAAKGLTAVGVCSAAALHRERTATVVMAALLAVSVAANVALLHRFGLTAAAVISSACELLLAGLMLGVSRDLLLRSTYPSEAVR